MPQLFAEFSAVGPTGNGRASSGALNVGAGQTIVFTIGSALRQSSASVR
jgi:hypothetical protein